MFVIQAENLTKYYGRQRGIIDVSFQVKEAEIFGFIGPNGAGKSTTIRIFLGLIFPDSGFARILGKDCITDGFEIRSQVGYVPGEVNYYLNTTVEELLSYSASFYDCVDPRYMDELCKRFELDRKKRFRELSTGNKKKVAIVQALLHRPKVIICDEPTNGLDPIMQNRLFELFKELKSQGVTVFFSSHILTEVQRLCDRFAMIKDGKIIKIESIESWRKKNYKLVRVQTPQKDKIERITNAVNVTAEDSVIKFEYMGEIDELMKELSRIQIENIWIEDPSIEDLFMSFYKEV